MKTIIIEGTQLLTVEQLHLFLKQQLNLPSYYGENLDALFDVLMENTEDFEIIITDEEILEKNLGRYAVQFLHVLADIQEQNENFTLIRKKWIVIENEFLDLEQIADSGQVFRWKKVNDGYLLLNTDKSCFARQIGHKIMLNIQIEEENYWRRYLDLDTDYAKIIAAIDLQDEYLSIAAKEGKGIRILQQDLWEMLVSFMISQNNNIPRIKNTIERICEKFGQKKQFILLEENLFEEYYTFPTLKELNNQTLEDLGLGYRQAYLEELIQKVFNQEISLEKLKEMQTKEAREYLKTIKGIGEKVASCIDLFGLHHLEAFPVDTWMKKVNDRIYQGKFNISYYGEYAGVIQQYLFYYVRKSNLKL